MYKMGNLTLLGRSTKKKTNFTWTSIADKFIIGKGQKE